MEYIFYEIRCVNKSITYNYIGSTINFTRRKCEHKKRCNNELEREYYFKIYTIIRDNGGWENWEMIPMEKKICESKLDARIYEQKLISDKQPTLNSSKAYMSEDEKKEYYKQYREQNREQIRDKGHQKINCECGSCYTYNNKTRHIKTQKHLNFISSAIPQQLN